MTTAERSGPRVSLAEFERIFESVKNWGRWGPDDQLGTLNLLTPERVRAAAGLVRSGRRVSLEIPINTVAGPDNPNPAIHHVVQGHDIDIGSGGLRFGLDYLGIAFHGDCHSHVDALNHISYDGLTYNGKPATEVLTTKGGTSLGIDEVAGSGGVVGRGVLLDIPRLRGVKWLEPGEAVTRAELEACEEAEGVHLGEGDIFVYRTGHHRRRLELGAWDNGPTGEGKAGLHVDTIPWMHERGIAAFLPDGDGEAIPSSVDGMAYPIHPLQIVAMGMLTADSLQFEDLARACEEEGRFDFMVVGLPLRLPGGTGSPWNPIAIF
jgi:kynurenine formamidase